MGLGERADRRPRRSGIHARFTIKENNGRGIPEAMRHDVMARGVRAGSEEVEELGLGLAIVSDVLGEYDSALSIETRTGRQARHRLRRRGTHHHPGRERGGARTLRGNRPPPPARLSASANGRCPASRREMDLLARSVSTLAIQNR